MVNFYFPSVLCYIQSDTISCPSLNFTKDIEENQRYLDFLGGIVDKNSFPVNWKRKVRHIFSLIPLLFVILVIYVYQHGFLNITLNHRVAMQYSGSTRPSLEHWGKKKVLGQLLSLSDMLPFPLSIYLLQVQFSLCFSCLALESAFFFFFPETPWFLFSLESSI